MPVSLVSEWSKRENVAMDPGYAMTDREGGTPALGQNVPGLTREQLSVIPADRWAAEKRRMAIDFWDKAVRRR
jgi:hypothetical protein